jgi:hypothetical protein
MPQKATMKNQMLSPPERITVVHIQPARQDAVINPTFRRSEKKGLLHLDCRGLSLSWVLSMVSSKLVLLNGPD